MIMHSRYLKFQTFSNLENAGLLWISEWKISVEGMFRKKFLNENSKFPTYSGSTTNIQWCGDSSYLLLCVSQFWNSLCAFSNAFPSYAIRSSNSPTDILKAVVIQFQLLDHNTKFFMLLPSFDNWIHWELNYLQKPNILDVYTCYTKSLHQKNSEFHFSFLQFARGVKAFSCIIIYQYILKKWDGDEGESP